MRENDSLYFHRRSVDEQVAAQRATCLEARHRHEELAAMYRFRAAMLTAAPPSWADVKQPEMPAEAA
jgi:hypothetical protein